MNWRNCVSWTSAKTTFNVGPDCQNQQKGSASRLTSNISCLSSCFQRFDLFMDWGKYCWKKFLSTKLRISLFVVTKQSLLLICKVKYKMMKMLMNIKIHKPGDVFHFICYLGFITICRPKAGEKIVIKEKATVGSLRGELVWVERPASRSIEASLTKRGGGGFGGGGGGCSRLQASLQLQEISLQAFYAS